MDGGQNQVVLIERRLPGEIAGGIGGVEGELGEEALARGILAGQQLELVEVAEAGMEVLVDALEMRLVPFAREVQLARPGPLRIRER